MQEVHLLLHEPRGSPDVSFKKPGKGQPPEKEAEDEEGRSGAEWTARRRSSSGWSGAQPGTG
jgi:hypothetical protein